ncbi:hypothetical protein QR680_007610 [Steinernema hermaphroditum]|uniref:Uncharacterized protein n=1 Tax=Steinernema hermaphroditum TaxID=289476 RepID=A0AA39IFA0_9BILA|nr:hypothetical protein QR680_007610 [Steinernema hermaphroditum]
MLGMRSRADNQHATDIGQRYDAQGRPIPSVVMDMFGNRVNTYTYDQFGGYYDESLFYYQDDGSVWCLNEYGHAVLFQSAADRAAEEAEGDCHYRVPPPEVTFAYQESVRQELLRQQEMVYDDYWLLHQWDEPEDCVDASMSKLSLQDKPKTEKAKTKKGLSRQEKQALKEQYYDELMVLGPNNRRLREEQLGIRKVPLPVTMTFGGTTYIATPSGDNYLFPYFFRDRYPGFVRDIEAIEGSYDPDLKATNPPKKISEIDKDAVYPEPYIGEHPPEKAKA